MPRLRVTVQTLQGAERIPEVPELSFGSLLWLERGVRIGVLRVGPEPCDDHCDGDTVGDARYGNGRRRGRRAAAGNPLADQAVILVSALLRSVLSEPVARAVDAHVSAA